jgi:hypothetical protein
MNYRLLLFIFCFFTLGLSISYAQGHPNRHSTSVNDGWLSCTPSANPNPARGTSHWIMYNLGDTYALTTSTVWNFNTPERINSFNNESWSLIPLPGKLEDGLRDVLIDLSLDGISWKEHGRFTIPKAPGSSFYEGVFGPDFGGKTARYILITAASNHGGDCYGLGEFKVKATAITTSNTLDPLANATLSAQPNPFRDMTTISLNNFPHGDISLTILDLMGKEIKKYEMNIRNEAESMNISGTDMPSGFYILKVTQRESTKSLKLEILR